MRRHPALLFRRAQPHPHDVGTRRVDAFDECAILVLAERAKRRRVRAAHLQPRESCNKASREKFRNTGGTAEEEVTPTALQRFGERMERVKGQHAVFGMAWNRSHPIVASGPQLADALVEGARELLPLYILGNERAVVSAFLK